MGATSYVANLMNTFDLASEKSKDDAVYNKGMQDYQRIKREIGFISGSFRPDIIPLLNDNGVRVLKRFEKVLEPIIYESFKKK